MYDLLRQYADASAIHDAYDAEPDKMAGVIQAQIDAHAPLCDRDHACRTYVSILRRVLKHSDADEQAKYAAKMKDTLAAKEGAVS